MMMRKQEPQSTAATALEGLNAAMVEWQAELRTATTRMIALEQSGVEPINPSETGGYDPHEAALSRLNGHTYATVPSGGTKNPGIALFETRRQVEELKKTLDLAAK